MRNNEGTGLQFNFFKDCYEKHFDETGASSCHGKTNIISFNRLIKFVLARTVTDFITNFNWFLV